MVGRRHEKRLLRSRCQRSPPVLACPALIAWPVRSRTYRRFDRFGRRTCRWRSCPWRTCRRRGCSAASRFVSTPRAQPAPLVVAVARDGQGSHPDSAGSWRRTRPARWSRDAAPSATPATGCCRPRGLTAHRRAGHPSVWCQAAFGGFPSASLPLEGLKRHDPHPGRCARWSKSGVMPISGSWRTDSDRKPAQLPKLCSGARALRSRRRRLDTIVRLWRRRARVAGRDQPAS